MVTAVCLNPAIDKTASVQQLRLMEVNRLHDIRTTIGGKGINVAIVLRKLQADVCCIGFAGEADERFIRRSMEMYGVPYQAIPVPGNVRCNLKVVDCDNHTVTEFNEQGAEVDAKAITALYKALHSKGETSDCMALCGSLPPGCNPDTYLTLMRTVPAKRWIVDTSGDALRHTIKGNPYLIKPNLAELEELAGARLETREAIEQAAMELCHKGVKHVAVSMGGDGAMLTDGERTVFAPAVPVRVKSTVGAGDAMLAGLLYGLEQGETLFASLRYGMAAGAACVQSGGALDFRYEEYLSLLQHVTVTEI